MQQSYTGLRNERHLSRGLYTDARDGLNLFQRRILLCHVRYGHPRYHAPQKVSPELLGEVLGKYHPHGDTAVYDAMARMVSGFLRTISAGMTGQGNFGSIDG
jgi:DNA gyrase subunit A